MQKRYKLKLVGKWNTDNTLMAVGEEGWKRISCNKISTEPLDLNALKIQTQFITAVNFTINQFDRSSCLSSKNRNSEKRGLVR